MPPGPAASRPAVRPSRRRRPIRVRAAADDTSNQIAEDRTLPDAEAADREEMARLSRAIAELPAALREPLILHTIDELSQAETAAILSISEKAVETRIRRARAKLAERFGRS